MQKLQVLSVSFSSTCTKSGLSTLQQIREEKHENCPQRGLEVEESLHDHPLELVAHLSNRFGTI